MSRLTIDISDEQHQSLKIMAALQGKTIRQFALERLFPADTSDDAAWQELKSLLTARIQASQAGKMSSKSVAQVLGEELDRSE